MRFFSFLYLSDGLYIISDKQVTFPPTSVNLKKPFAVKPWNGSDENIANLLMVSFSVLFFLYVNIITISVTNVLIWLKKKNNIGVEILNQFCGCSWPLAIYSG